MKHMSRLICAFGCLAMLSDIAPMGCVARADVAGPTYIHRLQRVGYEVLAEPGSIEWFAQNAVGFGVVLCALALGLMILLLAQIWMASAKTDVFDRIIGAARAHDFAEYICLALLVAGFVVFGAYQFGVRADFKAMAGGVDRWKRFFLI